MFLNKNFFLLIFVISLFGNTILLAQQQQNTPEVYKILGISVEGQYSGDPSAIIANTGLSVGMDLVIPSEQTRTAIRRLYNLKLFDDIQIVIENKVQDGVFLLIKVKENPRLETIEVSGNDELDEDDIVKKINLVKGQIVTSQDLSNIVRVLKSAYDEEGYLNAIIKPSIVKSDTSSRVILKIDIDEGSVVKVDNIYFHGNKNFDDGDLKGEMKETNERTWWKFWQTNKFKDKDFKKDKELILAFYKKNGYRDAEIIADSIIYSQDKKYMDIHIYVMEGTQYFLRNISFEGNTVYDEETLRERLAVKKGDVFNQEKFEQNLRRNESETDVTSLYADNGYLAFQAEPEFNIVPPDSLDVIIKIQERNQYKIGKVIILGNTKTYEKVIRRELLTKPGDYFSRQLIVRSLRQLSQLNYFNPEKLTPEVRPVDEKTVDLEYSVEERSSDTFNASVGYSGSFGFSGGLGLAFNNFSLKEPLRGGAGQVLSFDYQFGVSSYYRTFSIGFTEPWMFDTPTLFGFNIFNTRQSYYTDLHYRGFSVRVGRRFRWPDMYFRGDWTLRVQANTNKSNSTYGDIYSNYYAGSYYSDYGSQMGISQVISRNSTDSPIFPARGSIFSMFSEICAGPPLGGATQAARYHKHIFNMDWFFPLTRSNRITIMSSNVVGIVFPFKKDSYVPWQDRFFMGGTGLGQVAVTPLRGYEDNSVGPYNGGNAMMKFTLELRFALALHPIPIYTLFFAEAGNVWLDQTYMDMMDLRRSAGFGVRLLINPIGMLGFDYGYGFDNNVPNQNGPGWKFHFQFGKSM